MFRQFLRGLLALSLVFGIVTPAFSLPTLFSEMPCTGSVMISPVSEVQEWPYYAWVKDARHPEKIRLINPKNRWSIVVNVARNKLVSDNVDVMISSEAGYAIGLRRDHIAELRLEEIKE